MVGKMPNVTWLEGSFMETIKGWQSGWFYITEPRDTNWAVTRGFRSGVPMRLTSWKESGWTWGDSEELTGLQAYIQKLVDKKLKLVNVVQVMLIPDPPVSTTGFQPVGVRSGTAPDLEQALQHYVQRGLEGAVQGRRGSRIRYRGSRIQCAASRSRGKLFFPFTGYQFFIV